MFLWDLFAALGIIVVFSAILVGLFRKGKWGKVLLIPAYLFLAVWAGSAWVGLVGPLRFGMYWLPFLLAGLAVAMIFDVRRLVGNRRALAAGRQRPFPGAPGALAALLAMLVLAVCVLARYAQRTG